MSRNPENTFPVCNVSGRKARLFILLALLIQLFSTGLLAAPKNAFGDVRDNEKFPIGWFSYQGFVWQWGSWGNMACPVIPGTLSGPASVCEGVGFTISGTDATQTSPVDPSGVISYSWEVSTNGGTTWNPVSGVTLKDYSVPAGEYAAGTIQFRRVDELDIPSVCNSIVRTLNISVTINPAPTAVVSVDDATICAGESTNINIDFTGGSTFSFTLDGSPRIDVTSPFSYELFPPSSQSYPVTALTNNFGCTPLAGGITGSSAIVVNATPVAPTVTTPVIYCEGSNPTVLTATPASGNTLLWYTDATGGTGSTTPPTPLTNTVGSTIYYVSQVTALNCEGPRAAITVTVNATPTAPTVTTPVVYCQGDTPADLTATANSGNTLLWYTVPTGGTGSTTAPTPLTTIVGSVTYYVSQVSSLNCEGPRASITVIVNATPPAPTVTTPVVYCQGESVSALTATPASGNNLLWYTAATGGTGSTTPPTPITTTVGSVTYYVSQVTTSNCEGPRAAITVNVNAIPPAPTVTTPVVYCQGATASPLTATPASGNTLLWYTVATGGSSSTTAPTPITTSAGSVTYYASQVTSLNCEGPRAAITVTVNATPPAPTVSTPVVYCQGATATALTATAESGNTLLWYTVATGGTGSATAPTPLTATVGSVTYYVSQRTTDNCEGPRSSITVTVNATPAAPTVTTPITYCQGATATALTATPASGNTLLWYTVATGGTGSATPPTPSTTTVGSTIYYVSQVTNLNCEGPRAAITVNVNTTPVAPTVTTPVVYCQGATATALTATPVSGNTLLWYTVATGGTSTTTAPIPSTTTVGSVTYYVSQRTSLNCEGPRAAITVTVNATPPVPTVSTPVVYCQGATATALTATPASGNTLLWYTVATGGTSSSTAPTPITTSVGSVTYYVSQRTTDNCEGPRASITVTVNATPAAPTVTTPVVYCQGATATVLTATAAGTNTLLWYTVPTGGTGSTTAPTPLTNTVGSTIYYVSQRTNLNCEGPRASITVTVNATPAAPTVTTPVLYCRGAATTQLSATPVSGNTLLWYTVPSGGTGSTTAPTPSSTTVGSVTYYVSQRTSLNCEGPRSAITVTVNPIPTAPTVTTPVVYCQGATATPLTATPASGNTLLWYTVATGGTSSTTAPTPITTTVGSVTYYVSQRTTDNCEGPRSSITVTVNATPAAPTVTTPVVYCQGATATALTATATGSNTLLWYTVPTGGTGSTAPTPSTTTVGSTIYYVSQRTNLNCEGPRASITVTVNATPPAPTVTTPVVYCRTATASPLTATPASGNTLLWYTAPTGGTGSTIAPTPSTATVGSVTYYVSQRTTDNCIGPRAAIIVNVNATPAAPTVTTPITYCQGATATALTATPASGNTLLWYTVATGGTGSATPPTPSTTTVGSTLYYVSQVTNLNCEGPRAAITVNVNTTPVAPTVTTPVVYCQGATATALTATPVSGNTLLWYTVATGGTSTTTAPIPSTTTVGSVTYYVSQRTSSNCEGPRASITVTVNATPPAPSVTSPVIYCQGATATALTATPISGNTLLWYTVPTGGTGSATAPTPSTTTAGSVTYYVSQVTSLNCAGPRSSITVNVLSIPAVPSNPVTATRCGQGTAVIRATTTNGNTIDWYDAATGGTLVGNSASGVNFTTPSINGTTTFYAESRNTTTGCVSSSRLAVTVTVNNLPNVQISPSNPAPFCSGLTTTLTASGASTYVWTPSDGLSITTGPTVLAGPLVTTTYTVTGTDANGCVNTADVTLTIIPTPDGQMTSSPPVCPGDNGGIIELLNPTGTVVRWESSINGGASWTPITNSGTTQPYSDLMQTTIYRVLLTLNNGCDGYSDIGIVPVNPPFTPTATANPEIICLGESSDLSASDYGAPPFPLEDFQTANPAGWSGNDANNNNTLPNSPWGETSNGPGGNGRFFNGVQYRSQAPPTNSKFMIVNGEAFGVPSGLITPPFSLIGVVNPIFSFWHAANLNAGTVARVQISIDGGVTYTTLSTYTGPTNIGNPTGGFVQQSFNLSAYIGQPDVRIRFYYEGTAGSNWAVDNVGLAGTFQPVTYQWSPLTYLSPVDGVGQTVTTTPTVAGTYEYCVVATTAAGCASEPVCVEVLVNPLPPCDITGPATLCPGEVANYSGPAGMDAYQWTITGDGVITSGAGTQTITVTAGNNCGAFQLTLRTELNGCFSLPVCTFDVDLVDTQAPVVTGSIPPTNIEGCSITVVPAAVTTVTALEELAPGLTINDACTPDALLVVTSADVVVGTCPIVLTRTYTITDLCANFVTLTQIFNIDDTEAPVVTGTLTPIVEEGCVLADAPAAVTTVAALELMGVTIADLCTVDASLVVTFSDGTPGGTCPITFTRTYTVTDACGNFVTLTQQISVDDTEAPVVTGTLTPIAQEGCVLADAPAGVTTVAVLESMGVTIADLCTVDANLVVTFSDGTPAGTCPITFTRTYSVTDACGNIVTLTQQISVDDTQVPVWSTPSGALDRTIECSDNVSLSAAQALSPIATDICDNLLTPVKQAGSFIGSEVCGGTFTNSWTVSDECGNVSSIFSQTITVKPAPAATFAPVANTTQACGAAPVGTPLAYTNNAADPSCLISGTVTGVITGSHDECGGTYTETWTFTDDCNRTITATRDIVVEPAPAATFAPVANTTQACGAAPVGTPLAYTNNAADPSCLISGTVTGVITGSHDECGGTYTETWTFTDDCNRTITATRDIVVEPAPAA
ncbi:hypothetical protein MD537_18110, partial [Flavihumibacter sediminis]|nr:hypothetical protein [Flavihumibacter sediminis]